MNHLIPPIVISNDQIIVFSFLMAAPLEMVALTTSRIYLMIFLINITNIDKICDLKNYPQI